MVGDGRIRDLFTGCALLHADRFKRIEIQTGILFQDEHCVAVNKPAGLLVHRTELSRDTDYLLQRVRNQTGQKVFPVHRLDRPTSGVTLFVFSKDLASEFSREFRERNVKKTYLAVVRGWTEDAGVIDSPLKTKNGTFQDALTLYKTLARTELPIPVRPYETARYSLVEVDLKTGRNHQIRRHFAHLRHPLIGDTNHGDGAHNRMFKDKFNCSRLLLAATCLQLQHPITRKQLDIKAPLDPEFKILLQKTGLASNSKCGNDADCNCESDLHK
ncbi:hypothetical protein JYG24_04585 [Lentisphaerota bacterium]|nr:hypothetical protein JYG24_04585 [Lentisphaerota bacterium]